MFENLKTDSDIKNEADVLGGSFVYDTDTYDTVVKYAYISKSKGGALALNVVLEAKDNMVINQQFWMTSGTDKGCLNYFIDKQGAKQYLPGFNLANAFTLLTVGKEISTVATEEKVISLYSYEDKKEVPTKVTMLMEVLGKEITIGLVKQLVDKTSLDDATSKYVPTGETREKNEIEKLFRKRDGMTVTEIRAQSKEAIFKTKWVEKWKGQIKDKTDKTYTNTGADGKSTKPTVGSAAPQEILFT